MLCLHAKPAASSTTENGSFWFCDQQPKCHFICSEEDGYLYDKAIHAFLATNQAQPKCCVAGNPEDPEERNFAKIRVVKDPLKANYGDLFSHVQKGMNDVNTSSGEMKLSFRNRYVNMENRAIYGK